MGFFWGPRYWQFCLHWPTQNISFFYFPYSVQFIRFHLLVMAQVFHDKDGTKHHNMEGSSRDGSPVEKLEHAQPGYGHERDERAIQDVEDENPNVYHHMCFKLFTGLAAMSFLWVGSQIPLYLFGALLPDIYTDIGGAERYQWMVIGYLIPNASLCPFVGALSDMFGRRWVAAAGQVLLIVGPIVTATANTMNVAIGGQVISGLGAGLNELIALAGTAELVPTRKRGSYVGAVVFTILPFCPSVLWAQLIAKASVWRYVGALIAAWNGVGLILLLVGYKDPVRLTPVRPKKRDSEGSRLDRRHPQYRRCHNVHGWYAVGCFSVPMEQHPRPGTFCDRYHAHHPVLCLRNLHREVSDGAACAFPEGPTNHELHPSHHLLQRR